MRFDVPRPVLRGLALAALVAVSACSGVPRIPIPISIPLPGPGKQVEPIPTRPLNVAANCNYKDETGMLGVVKLRVVEAQVQQFEASADIPKRGRCRFNMKDFRQTKSMPHPELKANGSSCVVHMWEQGHRVTVAFTDCESMCEEGTYEYLWPFLIDRRDGSCA